MWAGEMAWQLKILWLSLNSISETPMIEGENQLAQGILIPPCIQSTVPSPSMPINKQTNKHYKKIIMLIWFPVYLFLINCPTTHLYPRPKCIWCLVGSGTTGPWHPYIQGVWNIWQGVKVPSSGSGHSPEPTSKKARQTMTPPQGESVVFWFSIPLSAFCVFLGWGRGLGDH